MGIFNRKKKTDAAVQDNVQEEKHKAETNDTLEDAMMQSDFVMGIEDTFPLEGSDDLIVVGRLKGKVRKGAAVYISNPGNDEDKITITTIDGIETGPGQEAEAAADCHAGLRINKGADIGLRKASVIFTRESTGKSVHDAYIDTLADVYVVRQDLNIPENELEFLTVTDMAEIWRLYVWYHTQVIKNETEEIKSSNRQKVDRLAYSLCRKIMQADALYCVFSKDTGEPYMFSKTVKKDDGYLCTPPDIRIYTKAYEAVAKSVFSEAKFEIRRIDNGEKKDGIYNFLGSTFYLNGACGVEIISGQTAIGAGMLVKKPDCTGVPQINIPVTNPDLERWLLLIGQLGKPQNADQELIYNLYYGFLSREAVKARLLIPMQSSGEPSEPDENGKVTLKKDTTLSFATMDGKDGRKAVRMFTDWKRLRMAFDGKWSGMVQPVEGMIGQFDCALNATKYPQAGCYISRDMFEDMKKR